MVLCNKKKKKRRDGGWSVEFNTINVETTYLGRTVTVGAMIAKCRRPPAQICYKVFCCYSAFGKPVQHEATAAATSLSTSTSSSGSTNEEEEEEEKNGKWINAELTSKRISICFYRCSRVLKAIIKWRSPSSPDSLAFFLGTQKRQ